MNDHLIRLISLLFLVCSGLPRGVLSIPEIAVVSTLYSGLFRVLSLLFDGHLTVDDVRRQVYAFVFDVFPRLELHDFVLGKQSLLFQRNRRVYLRVVGCLVFLLLLAIRGNVRGILMCFLVLFCFCLVLL